MEAKVRKAFDDALGDLVVVQVPTSQVPTPSIAPPEESPRLRPRDDAGSLSSDPGGARPEKRLQVLVTWLERNGYDEAAGSLREELEETLTVLKLELPDSLRRSLATTNAVENLMGKHPPCLSQREEVEEPRDDSSLDCYRCHHRPEGFRRIKGYREMSALHRALRSNPDSVDKATVVA